MDETGIKAGARDWIAALEKAIEASDEAGLKALLCDPAYLRDNGALTWDYRQFHGLDAVASTLVSIAGEIRPRNFRLSEKWPAPHLMETGETAYIEAFFDFDTRHGSGVLVMNAVPVADAPGGMKARAIFTRLEGLNSIEQHVPHPRGRGYTQAFPGQTWKQHRDALRLHEDREPDVIIVGAGQSGLTTAAHLRTFGVSVLVIDRYPRVGDSWAKRYDALALHNPVEMNGFPFLAFPPHYPEYLSKDLMGEWLDLYARYMGLNVWSETEFCGARFDNRDGRWTASVRHANGTERELRPAHIVLATGGIGGKPHLPQLPGLNTFSGPVLHSSQYTKVADHKIKKAIIVGVATSAHDIARDLTESGVEVTMFQRGPVVITNVATANLAYAGYLDPETPTALVDLRYGIGLINPLRERASQAYHKMAKEKDRDLLDRLATAGLRLGDGVDGQGFLDLFLRTGGGYYLNTGTSELIANGSIKIEQFEHIETFVPEGARLHDGTIVEAELIVLATGYQNRKTEVATAFGEDVAERVGDIARLDAEGEWASMWSQTGQRGLWFNGGGINQMRPGSERLALLIKADLDGLIPDAFRKRPRNEPARVREAA
ncbi:flavin-containing monooxygenase [Sphingomonas sp.]|uniref:flavin-containing monooxygenase n=1 Tax=Sphingomonas sp. TaxID=28214 RepID=UPI003B0066FC